MTSTASRTFALSLALAALLLLPLASADPIVVTPIPAGHTVAQDPIVLATPEETIPATCTVDVCTDETTTPSVSRTTPGVDPRTVTTPPVPVAPFCLPPDPAPFPLVCSDGTEVHPQSVGPTPGVGPKTVTVPSETIPAVCDATGQVCVGPFTVESVPLGSTPVLSIGFDTPGLAGAADAHAGETVPVGPFQVVVPDTPLLDGTTFTVCPVGSCNVQHPPTGGVQWSITVSYQVGDLSDSFTLPLQQDIPEA